MTEGETWIHTFAKLLPHDRPAWNEKVECVGIGTSRKIVS
jgi:hypothetical protein